MTEPSFTFEGDTLPERGVVVGELSADVLSSLEHARSDPRGLQSVFQVHVLENDYRIGEPLPAVAGRYEFTSDGIRFVPDFAFMAGVGYRASFDVRGLGPNGQATEWSWEFEIPQALGPSPSIERIYPSADRLPENLLRLYVKFSAPMQRGRVEQNICVLNATGDEAPDVLYRAPVELWDREMRVLTVLLDPGRLKRGVGPNRELGPPLREGESYSLVIGSGMVDIFDRRLPGPVVKRFDVTPAARERVDVESWSVSVPETWTREPLAIEFPRPLDWAMLGNSIRIFLGDELVEGRIETGQAETTWSFIPTLPWAPGGYRIAVASSLEDVCGNDLSGPFDRPLGSGPSVQSEVKNASRSFRLL